MSRLTKIAIAVAVLAMVGGLSPLSAAAHVLRASTTITVTEADTGHHYVMRDGETLLVRLSGLGVTWNEPSSSNQAVLERTSGSSGTTATATFVVASKGKVSVTSTGYPVCTSGGCPLFIVEFVVYVTVR